MENDWELSKENIAPLKQGRRMPTLEAALKPSSTPDHKELLMKKK